MYAHTSIYMYLILTVKQVQCFSSFQKCPMCLEKFKFQTIPTVNSKSKILIIYSIHQNSLLIFGKKKNIYTRDTQVALLTVLGTLITKSISRTFTLIFWEVQKM